MPARSKCSHAYGAHRSTKGSESEQEVVKVLYFYDSLARVRLHSQYQFSGMAGLPNFPEKMAYRYVIYTEYQYRGKSYNLRSNVVRILRFLIRLVIAFNSDLYPKICHRILFGSWRCITCMVNYFQSVTAQT